MLEPTSNKNYEEKFEFPIWKLVKQRAEEKDISYAKAVDEIIPDYVKTIRYRDTEFEDEVILKAWNERNEFMQHKRSALEEENAELMNWLRLLLTGSVEKARRD